MKTALRTKEDVERAMLEGGHVPGFWDHTGNGYPRITCGRKCCDRAAIVGPTHVYGSAIDSPCCSPTGEPSDG